MPIWKHTNDKATRVTIQNAFSGMTAFLCCPGPSLANAPESLSGTNRIVLALNTAYPTVRPDMWLGMDDPACYDSRLLSEAFPKFYRGGYGKRQTVRGTLEDVSNAHFLDCNMGGSVEEIFSRNKEDDHFIWVKHSLGIAIHLLVWLGAKEICFVGCDMGGEKDYCHDLKLTKPIRERNQNLYRQQITFLKEVSECGKNHDVSFASCTDCSPINEFLPFTPLEDKLESLNEKPAYEVRHILDVGGAMPTINNEIISTADPYGSHLPVLEKYRTLWLDGKVFEVGIGKHSTPAFLKGAASLVSVEEADKSWLESVRESVGDAKNWTSILESDTERGLDIASENGPYDVSFIDGLADTRAPYLERLFTCTKSMIIGHDILPMYKWDSVQVPDGWVRTDIPEHGTIVWENKNATPRPRLSERPVILHCNNFAFLGGIETTILDIAKAMPEYQHVMSSRTARHIGTEFVEYVKSQGVIHIFAMPEEAAAMFKPELILLHNCHIFKDRLDGYKVLGAHHNNVGTFTPADHDWFVSEWVRKRYGLTEGLVMPPPVYASDYTGVVRPVRDVPVVGRIQSATNSRKGKTTPQYFDLLRQLKKCGLFVVGNAPPDVPSAPIKPGMMPTYLKEVDIFTIWGNTTETWSRVVTEANLSGIPVVARNHNDGLTEQLRNSGGGVLVNTPQGFVENVQFLIDNPDKAREMGERGRAWALENSTTDVFSKYLRNEVL